MQRKRKWFRTLAVACAAMFAVQLTPLTAFAGWEDDLADDYPMTWDFYVTNAEEINHISGKIEKTYDHDKFKFTVPTSGYYSIYSTDGVGLPGATLYKGETEIKTFFNNYPGGNFYYHAYLLENTTYYVDVYCPYGAPNDVGSYTLNVSWDDIGNTADTATAASFNSSSNTLSGRVNYKNDVDMFAFTAGTNKQYTFHATNTGTVNVKLYSETGLMNGTPLENQTGTDVTFTDSLNSGAKYYLVFTANASCNYSLNVNVSTVPVITDDYGNDKAHAATWTVNSSGISTKSGTIETTSDMDVFKFTPSVSGSYMLWSSGFPGTIHGALYDGSSSSSSWGSPLTDRDYDPTPGDFMFLSELTAGTPYYVTVASSAVTPSIGSYTLHLKLDECGDTFNQATYIGTPPMGQIKTISGSLQLTDDKDMYKFTCPYSGSYRLYSASCTGDVVGTLYDSNGTKLATNDDGFESGNRNFKIVYNLTRNSQYYLEVKNYSSSTTNTGAYTLGIVDGDDYGNTISTAHDLGRLVQGATASLSASLETAADKDMFYFVAPITGLYQMYTSSCTGDVYGTLYDAAGTQLAYNDDGFESGDRNFRITYNVQAGVGYYVEVRNYSSTASTTGAYTLKIGPVDDYGNDKAHAAQWTLKSSSEISTISGVIESTTDMDVFKFTPAVTGSYMIWSTGFPGTIHGALYTLSSLLDDRDRDTAAGDFMFLHELTAGTTYYVTVASSTATPSTGAYTLHLKLDDCGDTVNQATYIGTPKMGELTTVTGSLELAGDKDVYKFTCPNTGSYRLSSLNCTGDVVGTLYDANGAQLASNDDGFESGNRNFNIIYTLTRGAQYYLEVKNYSATTATTGAYTLGITEGDDYGNTISNAHNMGTLASGITAKISGKIDVSGDKDVFKFTAPQNGTYYFYTTSSIDTVGTLYNSTGNVITSVDDNGTDRNFRISYSLTKGTVYYIEVKGYNTTTGSYMLCIDVPVSSIHITPNRSITLNKGQTEKLSATLTPSNSTDPVTWSSSDTSVATVSSTGLITALKPGHAIIGVMTASGYSDAVSLYVRFLGDVNSDGVITEADADIVLKVATQSATLDADLMDLADVDGDGSVTANDALLILQYATNKINSFPRDY